ncbi:hypothetical protein NQZ68_016077 [Dissostichus eleginoides]|nr:hypothetical protein NQZ68_016077 [Dissostichus eleginoides]
MHTRHRNQHPPTPPSPPNSFFGQPLASTQRDSPTQGPGEPAQQREKENKANLQSLKKLKVYFDSLGLPIAAALIRPQGD